MFSDNNKISLRQMKRLMFFDVIGVSCMIIPYTVSFLSGKAGVIALVLGTAIAVVYGVVMIGFHNYINEDYFEFSKKTIGKAGTFIFGILYFIKLFYSAVFVSALFGRIIGKTLLADTNGKVIIGSLIIVGAYEAYLGIEERGRIAEILYLLFLIPFIIFLITGLNKIDINNLMPLLDTGGRSIFTGIYGVIIFYSTFELLLFSMPYVREEKKSVVKIVGSVSIIAGIVNVLTFVNTIGILGEKQTIDSLWSSVTVMQVVDMPGGFIKRQDGLLLGIWILSIFTILSTLIFYLSYITKKVLGQKKHRSSIVVISLFIFMIAAASADTESLFNGYGRYMMYIGFPQSLVLPVILILVSWIKNMIKIKPVKSKEAVNEKN